jgi:predicted nucleic acid-binding Zn ribbon protein
MEQKSRRVKGWHIAVGVLALILLFFLWVVIAYRG